MYGEIEYAEFKAITEMPQEAATAWGAFEMSGLVGAKYKPVLYVGTQLAKGRNYIFIAEQILMDKEFDKKLVKIKINDYNGQYSIVLNTVNAIAFDN